jgi:hypothetical protein
MKQMKKAVEFPVVRVKWREYIGEWGRLQESWKDIIKVQERGCKAGSGYVPVVASCEEGNGGKKNLSSGV